MDVEGFPDDLRKEIKQGLRIRFNNVRANDRYPFNDVKDEALRVLEDDGPLPAAGTVERAVVAVAVIYVSIVVLSDLIELLLDPRLAEPRTSAAGADLTVGG